MSRSWKWILGLLAVLLVVGLVAGAVFMWSNHMTWWGPRTLALSAPDAPQWQQGPDAPYGYDRGRRYHMEDWGGRMPMMYGRGFPVPYAGGPFGTGFMIVGGLIHLILPLGILALVAYVFYQMGRRAGASSARPATPPDVRSLPARKVARR